MVRIASILLTAIGLLTLGQSTAHALSLKQQFCYTEYDWQELEMGAFVVLFPAEYSEQAQAIVSQSSEDLNTIYENYQQVFGLDLVLPIAIRIYPTQDDYNCVNPLAPQLDEATTHGHIGDREIALFADIFFQGPDDFSVPTFNAFRHELAILFAWQLSGGYAPDGLLKGLGLYAENPDETFLPRKETSGETSQPDLAWNVVWELSGEISDSDFALQASSIVSYLIDVHGWEKFAVFLEQISLERGYRQALSKIYGENLQLLESHWQEYFPIYTSERWRSNIFHRFDLTVYHELISAGAYADSISGLKEAVYLVGIFGTPADLRKAEELLEAAEIGAAAGELAAQSRFALLSGNYLESFTAAELSLDYYQKLEDPRRIPEVQTYLSLSKEILDLRNNLQSIQEEGIGVNPLKSHKVYQIGQRLLELGDTEGGTQAELILFALGAGQNAFFQFLISLIILISTGLIIRRILALRKPVGPEVDLL